MKFVKKQPLFRLMLTFRLVLFLPDMYR